MKTKRPMNIVVTHKGRVFTEEERQKVWDAIPEWRKDAIASCIRRMIEHDLAMEREEARNGQADAGYV